MSNNVVFDAPKSPASYEDFGISSLDSESIKKEASAQVLSEILADFGKEIAEGEKVEEKTASGKVAQEEKVKEEDKKEEEEGKGKKEEKEDKEEKEEKKEKAKDKGGKSAEDLALAKSLGKDAVAY